MFTLSFRFISANSGYVDLAWVWNSDSDGCSIAHSRVRGWRIFSELVTYYYYYIRKHTQIFWGILLELCHELHSYTSIPTAENEKFSTCS